MGRSEITRGPLSPKQTAHGPSIQSVPEPCLPGTLLSYMPSYSGCQGFRPMLRPLCLHSDILSFQSKMPEGSKGSPDRVTLLCHPQQLHIAPPCCRIKSPVQRCISGASGLLKECHPPSKLSFSIHTLSPSPPLTPHPCIYICLFFPLELPSPSLGPSAEPSPGPQHPQPSLPWMLLASGPWGPARQGPRPTQSQLFSAGPEPDSNQKCFLNK